MGLPLDPTKALDALHGALPQAALSLFMAFVLAFLTASLYRRLYKGPAYSASFFVTLIVTPIVVAMIMMAIGSNIARSVGLVGALSIIRFRTVIKDTRDMAFLFLMIGIGLCCGSGAYPLAVLGTVFVGAVLAGIHAFGKIGSEAEYILVVRQHGRNATAIEEALSPLLAWRKLHGAADLGQEDGCEYTYRIRLASSVTPESVIARLKSVDGLYDSSLFSPESQVEI